jgi:hypothetical protein
MKKLFFYSLIALVSSVLVFNACKKDEDIVLPPIGGFNNSNEVGAADLVAHFPCEEGKERLSGVAALKTERATYIAGVKGKCVSLDSGYVLYPEMPALNPGTNSYSMSCWVNVKNNGKRATMVCGATRPDHWISNFNILLETGAKTETSDTLLVKSQFRSDEANGVQNHDNINAYGGGDEDFKGAGDTVWTHIVLTYDPLTSKLKIYGNGIDIGNPNFETRLGVGDLTFRTPTAMLIGAFSTQMAGRTDYESWQGSMIGKVDEVRVWKKALSAAEIDALYQLEKAGR